METYNAIRAPKLNEIQHYPCFLPQGTDLQGHNEAMRKCFYDWCKTIVRNATGFQVLVNWRNKRSLTNATIWSEYRLWYWLTITKLKFVIRNIQVLRTLDFLYYSFEQ